MAVSFCSVNFPQRRGSTVLFWLAFVVVVVVVYFIRVSECASPNRVKPGCPKVQKLSGRLASFTD